MKQFLLLKKWSERFSASFGQNPPISKPDYGPNEYLGIEQSFSQKEQNFKDPNKAENSKCKGFELRSERDMPSNSMIDEKSSGSHDGSIMDATLYSSTQSL